MGVSCRNAFECLYYSFAVFLLKVLRLLRFFFVVALALLNLFQFLAKQFFRQISLGGKGAFNSVCVF